MSVRADSIAKGSTLEGVALFGTVDTLPRSLDSQVWANAEYWSMSGSDDAPARESLSFSLWLEILEASDDAPAREALIYGFPGYDWVTRSM